MDVNRISCKANAPLKFSKKSSYPTTFTAMQTKSRVSLPKYGTEDEITPFKIDELRLRPNFRVVQYTNGCKYEGEVANEKRHGHGVFFDDMGNVLQGSFVNDRIEGHGVYKMNNGMLYIGEWSNDLQNGRGKEIWPDGSTYEGDFVNGLKEGRGVYKWKDGSIYDGEWLRGQVHGQVG